MMPKMSQLIFEIFFVFTLIGPNHSVFFSAKVYNLYIIS